MTLTEAKRVAELVAAWEELKSWHSGLQGEKLPMVHFEKISARNKEGDGSTWDGEMPLPRDVALWMLLKARGYVAEQLAALGVDVKKP